VQVDALKGIAPVEKGFHDGSPFFDLITRGHQMIYDDETTSTKWLNQLSDSGLEYKVEGFYHPLKGWLPFANVRVVTQSGKSQVPSPILHGSHLCCVAVY
jgi:hypothetical protein